MPLVEPTEVLEELGHSVRAAVGLVHAPLLLLLLLVVHRVTSCSSRGRGRATATPFPGQLPQLLFHPGLFLLGLQDHVVVHVELLILVELFALAINAIGCALREAPRLAMGSVALEAHRESRRVLLPAAAAVPGGSRRRFLLAELLLLVPPPLLQITAATASATAAATAAAAAQRSPSVRAPSS